jgi:anti-anti-sigma factor
LRDAWTLRHSVKFSLEARDSGDSRLVDFSKLPRRVHRMTEFRLTEQDLWPGCHEIDVSGELDLAVSGRLWAALDRAVGQRLHVLVDLSACDFIDVSGVEVLLHGHERLSAHGCQLLLYGVRGQVRRMLSVTGLAGVDHGTLDPERDEALAAVA